MRPCACLASGLGLEAQLIQKTPQGVDRGGTILGQRRLQPLERPERIAPPCSKIRLQAAGGEVLLVLEAVEQPRPARVGGLRQGGHGGDAVAWDSANREKPLAQRAGEIAIGDRQLGQLRRQRVGAPELLAAPPIGSLCALRDPGD